MLRISCKDEVKNTQVLKKMAVKESVLQKLQIKKCLIEDMCSEEAVDCHFISH